MLPITTAQDEMLFEQILYPDRFNFKNALFLQVDSPLREQDLREALDTVSAEHEALRAAVVFHNVATVQQVITDRKIPLEMIDAEEFGSREMREMRNRFLYHPLDLQRESLMQVIYLQAGRIYMLCVLTHGIAFDDAQRKAYLARMMSVLKEKYPGDISWSVDVEGLVVIDADLASSHDKPEDILQTILSKTNVGVVLKANIQGLLTKNYSGNGYITSFSLGTPAGDNATYNFSITGSGNLNPVNPS